MLEVPIYEPYFPLYIARANLWQLNPTRLHGKSVVGGNMYNRTGSTLA